MDDLSENLYLCVYRGKDRREAALKENRVWGRPPVPEKVSFKITARNIQNMKDPFWKVQCKRSSFLQSEVCSTLPQNGPKKGVKFLTKNCKRLSKRDIKTCSTLKNWKI